MFFFFLAITLERGLYCHKSNYMMVVVRDCALVLGTKLPIATIYYYNTPILKYGP